MRVVDEIEIFINEHHEIDRIICMIGDIAKVKACCQEFLFHTHLHKVIFLICNHSVDLEYLSEEMLGWRKEAEYELPVELQLFKYTEFIELQFSKEQRIDISEFALCAMYCRAEELMNFLGILSYRPRYICADLWEGVEDQVYMKHQRAHLETHLFRKYIAGENTYLLWELARKFADAMCLKTMRGSRQPFVLNWRRNKDSDIELSIIFPVYNVSKYLPKCIESVTAWKADYVEFLFINDGATDDSRCVIEEYAKKDSRIKIIDKENGGCASARQMGLSRAKGKYIGFVDPDDFVDKDMFRRLMILAMGSGYDITYCGYNEFYENTGDVKPAEDFFPDHVLSGITNVYQIWELIAFARVAIWRGIYRREFLLNNNIHFYEDLKRFDDLPFKVETFAVAKSVIALNEPLYFYRLDRPGQDVAVDDERLYVHFEIFEHLNHSVAGMNIEVLNDYLQVCKYQTHKYAFSKIKGEFKDEYVKRAKMDLKSTDRGTHTYHRMIELLGEEQAKEYDKWISGKMEEYKR